MLSIRVLRPPAPGDVETIHALEAVAAHHDGHESLGSFTVRDLAAPSPESAGILASDDGRPVGYAHLSPTDTLADPHLVGALVVHPDHRGDGKVAAALLEAMAREAAADDAERVVLWVNGADDTLDRVAARLGFHRFSEQFQMRVPLPLAESPKWPPDVRVRSFVPGTDDADWLRVNNRAFRNHPDQGSWAETTLQRRIAEPWFDPAGFLLAFAEESGALAGFCWTKVHEDPRDGRLGEIYVVGVDPDHQGTGLGRALTVGGLEHLAHDRHCPTGMLYVDGANPPALGLYRALGFTVFRTDRVYELHADPRVTTRYAATREEIATWVEVAGAPRYRVDQVVDALYRQRLPLEDASALPRALRTELAEAFPLALEPLVESTGDDGETVKWLWQSRVDGVQVETVLMRYPTRATVCVSSQAGCAMGCTFCATGQAGFVRHLSSGEIVEQVVRAAHASPQPVNNVVFMGMGEPLANYDATWSAVERLHGDVGLSARHITISTVGIVPGIRRLATESLPVTLAISLHAPDDELRNTMIPINRRYPLAEVMDAAAELGASRGRRVTFEYACIAGVNDLLEHARALVRLLRPLGPRGSHVNLIPLNDTAGYRGTAPVPVRMQAFATVLRDGGLTATVRRNRGTDIDAACGQLRSRMGADPAVRTIADPSARMAP